MSDRYVNAWDETCSSCTFVVGEFQETPPYNYLIVGVNGDTVLLLWRNVFETGSRACTASVSQLLCLDQVEHAVPHYIEAAQDNGVVYGGMRCRVASLREGIAWTCILETLSDKCRARVESWLSAFSLAIAPFIVGATVPSGWLVDRRMLTTTSLSAMTPLLDLPIAIRVAKAARDIGVTCAGEFSRVSEERLLDGMEGTAESKADAICELRNVLARLGIEMLRPLNP